MKRVVASSQEQCVAKNSMQETKNGVRGGGGGGGRTPRGRKCRGMRDVKKFCLHSLCF
jgi:hypothetical protein